MKNYYLIILTFFLIVFNACRENDLDIETEEENEEIIDLADYSDWTDATHSNDADLNYAVVFNQAEVLRFDIKISSEDWSAMQSNLASILGSNGSDTGPATVSSEPMWVPCSLKFKDTEWYHVGIRYKGNSSLRSAYQSGIKKLSLKLDLDEFEDNYPALKNQRFYGFKQLNLNNNFKDPSLMHDKLAADLFRQFGLASANTAFCVVYLDNGSGPQYYGVYALVEEVDDTVIDTQFNSGTGNLYKPDGRAASFANGTYNTSGYELKTNEDSANYSDVKALYEVINSSERKSNTEIWKTNLENVFNVDVFLKWLAANTVIQNWDTYGISTHNYYLYNNPENGLLTWVPWDNNEAFGKGKGHTPLSLSLNEVQEKWPLIRYIIDQPEYRTKYESYLQKCIDEVFIPSEMILKYSNCYDLIKEYAYAENSGYSFLQNDAEFDQAVSTLKTHVQSRNDAVTSYLK